MKKILSLALLLNTFHVFSQTITVTPAATTQIITTNTNITPGSGPMKTYLVCSGATLFYQESSTMDTILLEPGATLKIDSVMSYGYSNIYAKAGSTVDINFRQVGKLNYVSGATILDTNLTMPSSFFMGSHQFTTINFVYTNLPGGVGCAPTAFSPIEDEKLSFKPFVQDDKLFLLGLNKNNIRGQIRNLYGQVLSNFTLQGSNQACDISHLSSGMYWVSVIQEGQRMTQAFLK
ncbi:MAG: T9SS type A sorting domain-containing protein [Chitinophagaceae bacterium]|nr:T9SS type A sorting domain-containing protein [Chitinophagaceae bacterium]